MQFDEYLMVLRKCGEWVANKRSEDFLLETGEMRRLGGSGFVSRLQQGDKRDNWARLLGMDRDAVHLGQLAPDMDAFLQASEVRLVQRRLRETRGRRSARALVLITVAFALLPTTLFSWLVQGPTMRRAELLFEAGNRANQALLNASQEAVGDAAGTLQSMLLAGALVDQARSGTGTWRMQASKGLLDRVGHWPLFTEQRDFLDLVFMQAEPPVNSTLRQLMQGAVWKAPPAGSADAAEEVQLLAPTVSERVSCLYEGARLSGVVDTARTATRAEALSGRLFVQRRADSSDTRPLRALFVPERPVRDRSLDVFSASVDAATGHCALGTAVLSSPAALNSSVVFDASLRIFYYTADGGPSTASSLIVQELDWERSSDGMEHAWQRQTLTSITDARALVAVKAAAGEARVAVLPTFRARGGRVVEVGASRWFVVNSLAQRVDPDVHEIAKLQPLLPAATGSSCELLSRAFDKAPGFSMQVLEQGNRCYRILRGWPAAIPGESLVRPLRDDVRVSVHEMPSDDMLLRANENPPAPLAAMLPFARILPAAAGAAEGSWWVGTSGVWDGWLLLKTASPERAAATGENRPRFAGAPLATCALWQVGRELLRHNPVPADRGKTAATLGTACTSP